MSIARHPDIHGNLTLTVPGWNSGGIGFADPQRHRDYGGSYAPEGAPPVGDNSTDAGEFNTLISLPSLGMNVELAFYYNSHSTANSHFGFRRTCNLHLRALTSGDPITSGPNAGARSKVEMRRGNDALVVYDYDEATQTFQSGAQNLNQLRFDAAAALWLEETPDGRVMAFEVGQPSQATPILWARDARGHQHTFEYDGQGLLIALHDAVGRSVSFIYNGDGTLKSLTDWAARTVRFEYDVQTLPDSPLLTRVVNAEGFTEVTYQYNGEGRVTVVRDAVGIETHYTYDGARVTARSIETPAQPSDPIVTRYAYKGDYLNGHTVITNALGHVTKFEIRNGNLTRVSDEQGVRHSATFDEGGREIARTNGAGVSWKSPRNAQGAPTKVVNGKGDATLLERDQWNNLTRVKAPNSSTESMVYTGPDDATGQKRLLHQRTDAAGKVTRYSYDARGLLVGLIEPPVDGEINETTWSYDQFGRQTGMTDALKNSTSQTYDAAGNVLTSTDAANYTSSATYDKGNRVTKTTDALENETFFLYDALGRLVQTTDALQHTRLFTYNVYDQVTSTTDEAGKVTRTQYDALGRDVATVDALLHRTQRVYNGRGQLVSTTIAAGELDLTTLIERDGAGQVVAMTDTMGARTTYRLDLTGKTLSSTDALENTTRFQYDVMGRLIHTTDALKHRQSTVYDEMGRVAQLWDGRRHVTSMAYDEHGRLASQTDAMKNVTGFEYDLLGRQSAVIDALKQRTTTTYDARGLVVANEDGRGHTTTTVYDKLGRAIETYEVHDGQSRLTSRTHYDKLGRVTSVADALGHTQSYVYDARGLMVQSTDAEGASTHYEYDDLGRQSAMIDELGTRSETHYDAASRVTKTIADVGAGRINATTEMVYDKAGRVLEERDALGHATFYEYDRLGRLTVTTGPNQQSSTMEYDKAGRVSAMVDALGHRTEYVLDENGNQTKETEVITGAENLVTSYQYDDLDRQIAVTDANNVRRETIYDAIGQVTGVRDGRKHLTRMEYDKAGQRTAVIDAKEQATRYVYNERGELVQETDPLNRSTFIGYDLAGRRTSSTDAKNQTTRWSYDKVGRVTRSEFADNTSIAYVYDAAGNLLRMTDSLGTTLYGYDALKRDTSVLYGSGHQLTYVLDVAGRRTKMIDPDGETTYVYDNSNRLTQLTNPQGEVTQFLYDKLDRVTQKTLANGVIETHLFDEVGRETEVEQRNASGVTLSLFASTYDKVGQRTSVRDADNRTTTYTYDDDGQLLSETREPTSQGVLGYKGVYTYDEVGNRLSKQKGDQTFSYTTTYVYNEGNELVSQATRNADGFAAGQGTTEYDANGNVTRQVENGSATTYLWNPQNYLVAVQASDGSNESYAYCGEGIRRTVTNASGTRRFIRDGKNILLEADESGDTIRRYTHMGEMWGELISLHEGSASRFYGFDGSANTRVLSDENAQVSDRYLYSAFGEELEVSGNSANPLRFGGEVGYYRDDAERVYVRARHLDVSDGRWLSRDPIGFRGGWNLYGYVSNRAPNFLDPSGLASDPGPINQGKIRIVFNAFIPTATVGFLGMPFPAGGQMVRHRGDNRLFCPNCPSARAIVSVIIDPKTGKCSSYGRFGVTTDTHKPMGRQLQNNYPVNGKRPVRAVCKRLRNGKWDIRMSVTGTNPMIDVAGIKAPSFQFSMHLIASGKGTWVDPKSTSTAYPAWEIWRYEDRKKPKFVDGDIPPIPDPSQLLLPPARIHFRPGPTNPNYVPHEPGIPYYN